MNDRERDDLFASVEQALMARGGKPRGEEIDFPCLYPERHQHGDSKFSAGWNRKHGAWFCQQCEGKGSIIEIAQLLGIELPKKAPPTTTTRQPRQMGTYVCDYIYRNEHGDPLFRVLRYRDPKDFSQQGADGRGGWRTGKGAMSEVRLVLYRLPELVAAPLDEWVFVAEGEKDADNLREKLGVTATSSPMGAAKEGQKSKWKGYLFNPALRGRKVCFLPDNDNAGLAHANTAAGSGLHGMASEIRIVRLPDLPARGDPSDWIEQGGTRERLLELVEAAEVYTPPTSQQGLNSFETTDLGNAEALAYLYGQRLRYNHMTGQWLVWGGHRWIPDADGQVTRLTKEMVRARAKAAADIEDRYEAQDAFKWGRASEAQARVNAAMALAKSEHPIAESGEGWNASPDLLSVLNGVADLRTGKLRPGRPEDRLSLTAGIAFGGECPRWLRFLEEVFEGDAALIEFIQLAAGYSLTGHNREQVWFLCHGTGRNGKSTFLRILLRLAGEYGANVSADTLKRRFGAGGGGGPSSDLARLADKRIVTAREMAEAALLDEERVKALTHGDRITARFLHKGEFEFDSVLKLWVAANHLPEVRDTSEGFWRSVRLIPFKRAFNEAERQKDLDAQLDAELPGILAWAIDGAIRWYREGLPRPIAVWKATDDYREQSDPLSDWMAASTIEHVNARGARAEMYASYLGYCEEQHVSAKERLGAATFGRRIGDRFPNIKSNGKRFYVGIGLGVDPLQAPFEQAAVTVPVAGRPKPCGKWCEDSHPGDSHHPNGIYWQHGDGSVHCPVCHPEDEE